MIVQAIIRSLNVVLATEKSFLQGLCIHTPAPVKWLGYNWLALHELCERLYVCVRMAVALEERKMGLPSSKAVLHCP